MRGTLRSRRSWRAVVVSIATTVIAATVAAQTPVLGSLEAPYPALQNAQPIQLAGNSFSAGQVAYGSVGTPLVLSGSNLGDQGEVWFISYKNGSVDTNAASVQAAVTLWTPTAIFLSVPTGATSGLVKLVTDGKTSNGLPFMVMPGAYSGSCPGTPTQNQLQIQTTSLRDGAVNLAYSVTLSATGGSNNYTWTILAGSLPAGLTLSSSGTIFGTPSAAGGPVSITVQVTDTSTPQQHDSATLSLQIDGQPVGVSSAALYSFSIANTSGGSGYDSVGNVTAYTDTVNGTWTFNYDTLNRLANAAGTQADDPYPNYCWQYESFGNRLWQTSAGANASANGVFATTAGGANACTVNGAQGPSMWAQYNGTVNGINNNQMSSTSQNVNQGQNYDASGNITNDGIIAYLYDGEGRICAVQQQIPGIGTAMTQYLYDADGNRVAKGTISTWSCDTAANGFTAQSAYVLGPGDERLTEMSYTSGTWQWVHTNVMASGLSATYEADLTGKTAGPLYFHLSDWLGTRRQQTDYAGNPCLNFTGLPFGDSLTTIPVSNTDCADATEHHYTGKERDTESGNDYFPARYYASSMGRFLSPDPSGLYMADPENPQMLNLYSYVGNNPLRFIDPDGLDGVDSPATQGWLLALLKSIGHFFSGLGGGNSDPGPSPSAPGGGGQGPEPGDQSPPVSPLRFPTRDAAGIAAARQALGPTSRPDLSNKACPAGCTYEWGGRILQNRQSGQYTFTQPVTFKISTTFWANHVMVPFGYRKAGSYHTHPGFGAPGMSGSSGDAGWADAQHLPEYMGEQMSGKVWKYAGDNSCSAEPCGTVIYDPNHP